MSDQATSHEPGVPRLAGLLAEPARAAILWTLIDGTIRPAGELARAANISAQAASAHLAKLVRGGLLLLQPQGRHRYYRLAGPEVADALESFASLSAAVRAPAARDAPPAAAPQPRFAHARTCYDHLAGVIAVRVLDSMVQARWLAARGRDFDLTPLGAQRLSALQVDLDAARGAKRAFARVCVDVTERRPHLGGALGAALLDSFRASGWIRRLPRSRVVSVTPEGHQAFWRLFEARL